MSAHTDVLRDIIEQMEELERQALAEMRASGEPDVAHELGEKAEHAVMESPESEDLEEAAGDEMGAPADLEAEVETKKVEAPEVERPAAISPGAGEETEEEDEDTKKAKSIVSGMFGKRSR